MAAINEPIRVLIVDDSAVVRRAVSDALSSDPEIAVVGTASNGIIAIQRISQLNPDVIILDIEMPEMDGFGVLRVLRANCPKIRTIMFSSLTQRGAVQTIEALSLGANDYIAKPACITHQGYKDILKGVASELIPKIKQFSQGVGYRVQGTGYTPYPLHPVLSVPRVVAIGISTGGPEALSRLIPVLPKGFPVPIMIVQHMPPIFTKLLAERLNTISDLRVIEGHEGVEPEPGVVYIAPGDFHMTLQHRGDGAVISLNQGPPENFCRPAVDALFRSVAKVYGPNALGIIMTGMGQDGYKGVMDMKKQGALVFAQDQASSVVWGMPSAVINGGFADCVLPLDQISSAIDDCVSRKQVKV
ncbi:MAG: chemotaxis response regulator protein-glutamate methylesterase [Nitrospirae bacterium]|nr:chemotaxis response regulator protein-glutamate methylesterase [Nitrospirota bacterium]